MRKETDGTILNNFPALAWIVPVGHLLHLAAGWPPQGKAVFPYLGVIVLPYSRAGKLVRIMS